MQIKMIMKKKEGFIPRYKILVVGSKGVGKTQIIKRYINNSFTITYEPTESFESYNKIVNLSTSDKKAANFARLNIIDTFPFNHDLLAQKANKFTGEEQKRAEAMHQDRENIYRHTNIGDFRKDAFGFILVYESGNQKSFDELASFVEELVDNETGPERSSKRAITTYKLLIESKTDLNEGRVKLDEKKLHKSTFKKYNIVKKISCSAKLDKQVITDGIFALAKRIYNDPLVKKIDNEECLEPAVSNIKGKNNKGKSGRMCCGGYEKEEEEIEGGEAREDPCVLL